MESKFWLLIRIFSVNIVIANNDEKSIKIEFFIFSLINGYKYMETSPNSIAVKIFEAINGELK